MGSFENDCCLSLLGRPSLSIGQRPVDLQGKSVFVLLAYLALKTGGQCSRDEAATLLWGDRDDKLARQSLRQLLTRFNAALGPYHGKVLVSDRDILTLNLDATKVDALRFRSLAKEQGTSDLEKAAALYGGTFLNGIAIDAEEASLWLAAERERLMAQVSGVFERLALAMDAAGRGPDALDYARKLVEIDPYIEACQRLLIDLTARHEGSASALKQGALVERLLRDEFGVGLEPETRDLLARIRATPREVISRQPPDRGDAEPPDSPAPLTGAQALAAAMSADVAGGGIISVQERDATLVPPSGADSGPAGGSDALIPSFGAHGVTEHGSMRRDPRRITSIAAAMGAAIVVGLGGWLSSLNGAVEPPRLQEPAVDIAAPAAAQATISVSQPSFTELLAKEGRHTIVVLPIQTDDNRLIEPIAKQLTDNLINDLSRVPAVRVIARSTSEGFRHSTLDSAAIANELGVSLAIEASIRERGSRLIVNVALVDARTRLQQWATRLDLDPGSPAQSIDLMIQSIARQVHVAVMHAAAQRATDEQKPEPSVADLVARGWNAIVHFTGWAEGETPEDFFQQALARDPANTSAALGLGGFYAVRANRQIFSDFEPDITRSQRYLDLPGRSQAGQSLVLSYQAVNFKTRGHNVEGLAAVEKAIEINPAFAPAHAQRGHFLLRLGKPDEAFNSIQRAMQLSPKDPQSFLWQRFAGEVEIERGNLSAARALFVEALKRSPNSVETNAILAAASALGNDSESALRHFRIALKATPGKSADDLVGALIRRIGIDGQQEQLVEGLRRVYHFTRVNTEQSHK